MYTTYILKNCKQQKTKYFEAAWCWLTEERVTACWLAGWLQRLLFLSVRMKTDAEADVGKKGECWLAITIEPDNEADVGWLQLYIEAKLCTVHVQGNLTSGAVYCIGNDKEKSDSTQEGQCRVLTLRNVERTKPNPHSAWRYKNNLWYYLAGLCEQLVCCE